MIDRSAIKYASAAAAVALAALAMVSRGAADEHRVAVTITSKLLFPNVPFDPVLDFAELLSNADIKGVLDPGSLRVVNLANGETVIAARPTCTPT